MSSQRTGRVRRVAATVALLLAAAVFPAVGVSSQSKPSNAELAEEKKQLEAQLQEQRRIRAEAQQAVIDKAVEVDVAQARVEDVIARLEELDALVIEQRSDLEEAELALAAADAAVDAAEQRALLLAEQESETGRRVIELIVQQYIGRDASEEASYGLARTGDIYEAARIKTIIGAALGDLGTTADELRALGVDAGLALQEFQFAADLREQRRTAADEELSALLDTVAAQEQLFVKVEELLEHLAYEHASLAEFDAQAAQDVQATTTEIANIVKEQKRRAEAERRRKAEEARKRREAAERARRLREGTAGQPTSGNVSVSQLTWVGGIQVHESIANNVQDLLEAAARDGIKLSGGGYRSHSSQIYLRKAHCGTSDYAVYQKPSYQCRPPTARPGYSMHERGLAIDFRSTGTRSTKNYKWLKANAHKYGLYNLPSEPWHWSTNGR